MSDYFKGVTFPWQEVTPSDDAIVRRAILPDRCLSGCKLTYSGYTLTMAAGSMIVCGRQFKHTAAQNWAITGATSGYARLLLAIDVTKASTEDAFEQIITRIEYASAVDGFSVLRQDDINSTGTIYQVGICVVALGTGGITRIVSSLTKGNLDSDDVGAAPAGLHRCYGSLKDIGITTFPTTMSAVANAMPANSMIVIDTRSIKSGGTEEISDWGNESNGTAYINRGYSVARVTMAIFYGSGSSVKGRLFVGSYAGETNTVGWTDYGYDGNADCPGCFYRTVDGVAEWINPPMIAGTEYRTAERYNGRVVYAQLVSLGNMPNNTVKNTTFKPTNVVDRISCEVMMQLASANHTETCPAIGNTISDIETMATWFGNNTDSVIRVTTSQDRSKYKGFALCKYTKG
jgi:hypothetical protein